ncbi:MAG TPA: hypothetical protein VEB69_14055 [Acidimicrobiia bacterium]|nr:hypothetical protein [Acidimicrobiia bacterium]
MGPADATTRWDLRRGDRAFDPGDDPYGWGRQFVAYMDVSGQTVALILATVEAENFLSGLVVDPSGVVHDLTRAGDHSAIAGSFIP